MPSAMCWQSVSANNQMTPRIYSLIEQLADGRFHSGESLGQEMGISRAAVWKMIPRLEELGLEVYAISGKGYRLAAPFEPLDPSIMQQQLTSESSQYLAGIEVLRELDSTNRYLLQAAAGGANSGSVCLAEYQYGGRGRRGRNWASPYGGNIYLSLLWRFNDGAARLGGLSLAVAVALMRLLQELGVEKAGIKWPNDILVEGKKLAGILSDVAGESHGPCHVVIGIGMNYQMSQSQAASIGQPWVDLSQLNLKQGRNEVAGRLIHHLLLMLTAYQKQGLSAFIDEWRQWDLARDNPITIQHGDKGIDGVARGIDEQGLLLVEHGEALHKYASGEVSLRLVAS
jgi:BirA family transcriptional regulator, biotin operon repressor / biotin---[acetyl-CoA-carboxylase] ligase